MGVMSEQSIIIGSRDERIQDEYLEYLDRLHDTQLVENTRMYSYLSNDHEISEELAHIVVVYWSETLISRHMPGGR
jgi:hypothetical protein